MKKQGNMTLAKNTINLATKLKDVKVGYNAWLKEWLFSEAQ